jgi:hypothetical protein
MLRARLAGVGSPESAAGKLKVPQEPVSGPGQTLLSTVTPVTPFVLAF